MHPLEALANRLRLMVVTDRARAAPHTVEAVVRSALRGGVTSVQLREKEWGVGVTLPLAVELRKITRKAGALFLVNDRLDLALACEADGVHLGPTDIPVAEARALVTPPFIIGYSTDDPDEALTAARDGADYIGCGTVWPTGTKADAGGAIGPEGVRGVTAVVSIPIVAIGGVSPERVPLLAGSGAAGVAVCSGIMGALDPEKATREYLSSVSALM